MNNLKLNHIPDHYNKELVSSFCQIYSNGKHEINQDWDDHGDNRYSLEEDDSNETCFKTSNQFSQWREEVREQIHNLPAQGKKAIEDKKATTPIPEFELEKKQTQEDREREELMNSKES